MDFNLNLNIFEEIIKSYERWGIRKRLQKIRHELFRLKHYNRFFNNPSVRYRIDELNKEEEDLRKLLARL